MARLEEITVGSTVKGIIGDEPVMIVAVQWYGTNVLEITYKNSHCGYAGKRKRAGTIDSSVSAA